MSKTCFVIMGYGVKQGINLDETYQKIIKPCILENKLLPYPLYNTNENNAYRCDEIGGGVAIDYKFVTCLSMADIVIADISTMNNNAVYELGARHALKSYSTILLCAKNKKNKFKFFDIENVPIIFYEHNGKYINQKVIDKTKSELSKRLRFCIDDDIKLPDNPISRGLAEHKSHLFLKKTEESSLYELYLEGKRNLDNNNFEKAEKILKSVYVKDNTVENLCSYILAKYKSCEKKENIKGLYECLDYIDEEVSLSDTFSEDLLGIYAAINLRIFNLSKDKDFYYKALEYYAKGMAYCNSNLYCPRNYCALLLRVYEVTDDPNIITEYYYTSKHYSKYFLHMKMLNDSKGEFEKRIYYKYNKKDLEAIVNGYYENFRETIVSLKEEKSLTELQKNTIIIGLKKLNKDIREMEKRIKSY